MFAADKISKDHRNRIYLNMIYSQVKDFLTTISGIGPRPRTTHIMLF